VYLCTYFADHAALCKPPHGADVPEGTDLRSGTTSPQGSLMTKLSSQQVGHLVRTALTRAASQELELRSPRSLVYMRSRAFCGALAAEMRSLYPAEDGFAVFAGRDPANRTKFGRQELMGDVSVYEVAEIPAGHHGSGNAYLKRALWMIESEFDASPKAALRDFIKFVAGSAAQKLFVAPRTKAGERVLGALAFPVRHSGGENFVALVPHPRSWDKPPGAIALWQWQATSWQQRSSPGAV
jgi:hypothetical protein